MVQRFDLAENTRYRQAGFECTMPTLRYEVIPRGCNVVLRRRLGRLASAAIVFRFHRDRISLTIRVSSTGCHNAHRIEMRGDAVRKNRVKPNL